MTILIKRIAFLYEWLSMYILSHSTVFFRAPFLFFIHFESIMKRKAILQKFWTYFREDILHSSKGLLPGIVFHNLEVGKIWIFYKKNLSVSRGHRYLSRRGLGCRSGSTSQDKSWALFTYEWKSFGRCLADFFCVKYVFSHRNQFINGGWISSNQPLKVYLAKI